MNEDAWDKVEVDFCAGVSFRVLATKYGVSHVAIKKKKDKEGWVKGGKPTRKALRAKAQKEKAPKPKLVTTKPEKPVNPVNRVNQTVNQTVNQSVNHLQLVKQEVGHPTIKTPELLDAIFDAIANGKSTRAVCVELGFSRESFYKWARTDREFMYQYACAKRFCADFFIEDIIEIADDSSCDTYVDEKGRIIVDHEVIARSKIRIEARQWAAMRLNSRKYNLPMIESPDDKPVTRRIEVSFVSGDGVVSAGRSFDQNGKVVQLGPVNRDSP